MKSLLICTLLLLLLGGFFTGVYSQSSPSYDDPLQRPEIWAKLKEQPNDMSYWVQYFGKPWLSISMGERDQLDTWRKYLLRKKAERPITASESDVKRREFWEPDVSTNVDDRKMRERQELERVKYHQMLTEHIMREDDRLLELKQNIDANFIIIEDIYRVEFAELGQKYIDYSTTHPKGYYPKIRWIEEQSAELRKLKREHLTKLKEKTAN